MDKNSKLFKQIQKNGAQIRFLSEAEQNKEVILAAVKQNGWTIQMIKNKEAWTEDICLTAVQQNGLALHAIPLSKRSFDVCLAAVQQNGDALEFVPEELLDSLDQVE